MKDEGFTVCNARGLRSAGGLLRYETASRSLAICGAVLISGKWGENVKSVFWKSSGGPGKTLVIGRDSAGGQRYNAAELEPIGEAGGVVSAIFN